MIKLDKIFVYEYNNSGAGVQSFSTISSIYDDMTGRAAQGVKALITTAQRYGFNSKQFALVNRLYGKAIQAALAQGMHREFVISTAKIIGITIDTPIANYTVNKGINVLSQFFST